VILVDTSVWVDHLRADQPVLRRRLEEGIVLGHPWVTGEVALGRLAQRREVIGLLMSLPTAAVATPSEMLAFIDRYQLMGRGVGYVDIQLLAATALTADARLWTRDKRLAAAAAELGLAVE
jgi:predicted nucleic acid-binding protein